MPPEHQGGCSLPSAPAPTSVVAKSMVIGELQDKVDEYEELALQYQKDSESFHQSAASCRERARVLRKAIVAIRDGALS